MNCFGRVFGIEWLSWCRVEFQWAHDASIRCVRGPRMIYGTDTDLMKILLNVSTFFYRTNRMNQRNSISITGRTIYSHSQSNVDERELDDFL